MEQETPPRRPKGPMPRLIAVIVMGVAFVGLLYAATRPLGSDVQPSFYVIGSATAGMQIGQIAPGSAKAPGSPRLALIDVDGGPVALGDFSGRPIWIIFWKTACQPCEAEAPDVAAAYAEHQSDGLVILGVNPWDPAEAVSDYASAHSLSYPIAIDAAGGFMSAYGVWGAPTHYFIDSAGIIEARQFGPMTRDLIEKSLHRILYARMSLSGADTSHGGPLWAAHPVQRVLPLGRARLRLIATRCWSERAGRPARIPTRLSRGQAWTGISASTIAL